MSSRRIWVLNLDAELELEGRAPYAGPLDALERRPQLLAALERLVPAGDVVLRRGHRHRPAPLEGAVGRAWCPTPAATQLLREAGARTSGPPPEVLRAVAHRGFGASLGRWLEGGCEVREPHEARDALARPSPTGRWLLRRAFGFAGRGRRTVIAGAPRPADLAFAERAAHEGGLSIEPLVDRLGDFGLHGWVGHRGPVLGEPTVSEVDRGGIATRLADRADFASGERSALFEEAARVATALAERGFHGPFGIDGFRYRWGTEERFCPRCEINPRYSMGWAVGMGDRRPDLDP